MSFIISVFAREGLVLASDSRTTYGSREKKGSTVIDRIGIHTTDTSQKTFLANQKIGISVCGDASIEKAPISGYVEDFIRQNIDEQTDIDTVPDSILEHFRAISPNLNTTFIIAGYSVDNMEQRVYRVRIGRNSKESFKTQGQGAVWDGESVFLSRLLRPAAEKTSSGKYNDYPFFPVNFNHFTLQDAVDFARYAVDVTINTMRFQAVVETVGGPVDILALRPSGATWVQKKELH